MLVQKLGATRCQAGDGKRSPQQKHAMFHGGALWAELEVDKILHERRLLMLELARG